MVLIRLIDGLNEIVGKAVSYVAVIFAGMIIYDVVMRYGFNAPTLWAFDLTMMFFGFYFVLLGGYALRHQAHVKVDLVTENLPSRPRQIVEVLGYLIFFFPFCWVFVTKSWEFALRSYAQGETTYGAVQIPVYPVKIAMAVAACLLAIQGVSEVLKLIFKQSEQRHVG